VHQSQVLSLLFSLKFVNGNLTVIDSEEVNQFLIVSNVLVSDLNGGLKVQDIILLALA
jgi:hypothetical protein